MLSSAAIRDGMTTMVADSSGIPFFRLSLGRNTGGTTFRKIQLRNLIMISLIGMKSTIPANTAFLPDSKICETLSTKMPVAASVSRNMGTRYDVAEKSWKRPRLLVKPNREISSRRPFSVR